VYNALDQLVKQSGGPSGTVHYVYDEAGHLLGEYNSTGALIQETIWLGDTPVATLRPGTPIGIFYVHTDHLNTPRRVTQPSGNQLRWTWEADPFGTATPNENPASLGAFKYNLRFPGQIYDSHGGLMQNYFRDYDPAIGRYVESDPIGLLGGLNTYAYARGNPIRNRDELGLAIAHCGEDESCVQKCLREYYGSLLDTAWDLSPFSFVSFALDEASSLLEDALKKQATRNLNSPDYYIGKRQMRTLQQFRRFNAASAVVGAGAAGFLAGAYGTCALKCAFR
jgi:RHS repeat-associated protein